MTVARGVIFAVFGLVFGSFLTVVVHRVPRKESIVAPRSACPSCGTEIRSRDNIPVVSYLLLRGRCRTCGTHIPVRYPLIEAGTAALFAGAGIRFHSIFVGVVVALFFLVMVAVAIIDIEHRIIPNRIVYPSLVAFTALVAAGAAMGEGVSFVRALIGLAAFGGVLLVVALIAPSGMGMGDVKLAALIGLVLGGLGLSYVAVAAGAAILAGGLGGLVALMALRASRKDVIPFGPYLAAGAVAAAFLAPRIASWYGGLGG